MAKKETDKHTDEEVILLEDLVPQQDVKGGAAKKIVFGQPAPIAGGKKPRN